MNEIKINYSIEPKEMAAATVAFLNLKPIARFSVFVANLGLVFIGCMLLLKFKINGHLAYYEYPIFLIIIFWLFFRKKFNFWFFKKKLQAQALNQQNITLTLSTNGVIWGGIELKSGSIMWHDLKKCYQIKDGYILPTSPTRFLWLPLRGFNSGEQLRFEELLQEKQVLLIKKL